MMDIAFAGLKLLRDAYKYVREAKRNVDMTVKELDRIRSMLRYCDTTMEALAELMEDSSEQVKNTLRPVFSGVVECKNDVEPFVRKQDIMLKPILKLLQFFTKRTMGAQRLAYCVKSNTVAACSLIETVLHKKVIMQAEATEQIGALGEALQAWEGPLVECALWLQLLPESLHPVATRLAILKRVARSISVGDGSMQTQGECDDDTDEASEQEELAKLVEVYGEDIQYLVGVENLGPVCEGVFHKLGGIGDELDLPLLEDILGDAYEDIAKRLYQTIKGPEAHKLTTQAVAAYMSEHAKSNSGMMFVAVAGGVHMALKGLLTEEGKEDLFLARFVCIAETVLEPLLEKSMKMAMLIAALMVPEPEDEASTLDRWLDNVDTHAKDIAANVKYGIAPLKDLGAGMAEGMNFGRIADMGASLGSLKALTAGTRLRTQLHEVREERDVVEAVARELQMTTTTMAATMMLYNQRAAEKEAEAEEEKQAKLASEVLKRLTPAQRTTAAARALYDAPAAGMGVHAIKELAQKRRHTHSEGGEPTRSAKSFSGQSPFVQHQAHGASSNRAKSFSGVSPLAQPAKPVHLAPLSPDEKHAKAGARSKNLGAPEVLPPSPAMAKALNEPSPKTHGGGKKLVWKDKK